MAAWINKYRHKPRPACPPWTFEFVFVCVCVCLSSPSSFFSPVKTRDHMSSFNSLRLTTINQFDEPMKRGFVGGRSHLQTPRSCSSPSHHKRKQRSQFRTEHACDANTRRRSYECKKVRAQSGILTRGRIGLLRLSSALMSPVSAGGPRRATLYHPASVVSSPSSPSLQQAEENLSLTEPLHSWRIWHNQDVYSSAESNKTTMQRCGNPR